MTKLPQWVTVNGLRPRRAREESSGIAEPRGAAGRAAFQGRVSTPSEN